MRLSLRKPQIKLACLFLMLTGFGVSAQMAGPGGPAGMTAAITKLFGDNRAFTAKTEVQLLDNSQKEIALMPMNFSLLDKSIRVEMDLSQVKNREMPPGTAESLKQMGMARVISIINPGKKAAYVLYPDQKMMLTIAVTNEEPNDASSKLNKTSLGNETVDGHPCVKNKVTVPGEGGEKIDVTMWNATDLKDFPVQIQTKERENTSIMRFKQVQLTKPEASLFEPPSDYTQYASQQELMQAILKKMAPGVDKK
ncbi:MAG TPA: DUF4412 domain-containing protein [Candidatus Limnocylindrales bacterium]|nr:DUF4412 domain-containing protein [Candidatus Limnocylindrales bacterium]